MGGFGPVAEFVDDLLLGGGGVFLESVNEEVAPFFVGVFVEAGHLGELAGGLGDFFVVVVAGLDVGLEGEVVDGGDAEDGGDGAGDVFFAFCEHQISPGRGRNDDDGTRHKWAQIIQMSTNGFFGGGRFLRVCSCQRPPFAEGAVAGAVAGVVSASA